MICQGRHKLWIAGLLCSLVTTLCAGPFVPPAEGPVAFRRDKLPLDSEALVEAMGWFTKNRDSLPEMRLAARRTAERNSWENYRRCVTDAVAPFV